MTWAKCSKETLECEIVNNGLIEILVLLVDQLDSRVVLSSKARCPGLKNRYITIKPLRLRNLDDNMVMRAQMRFEVYVKVKAT